MDIDDIRARLQGLFADTLGIELVSAAQDRVLARLEVKPAICTTGGILHGGAMMAFADTLGAIGTVMNLEAGKGTATIDSHTTFVSGAPTGTTVFGESTPLHRGRRTMAWQTRITNADGKLLAQVTQTQIVL
jgi:uncharacterized protein (TIGR00369 family)